MVILLGKDKGSKIYHLLLVLFIIVVIGIILGYLPIRNYYFDFNAFAIQSSKILLKNYEKLEDLVKAIYNTITFSRTFGFGLIISYIIAIIIK
jgi:1,4-dihydroxy-2-naphthoate octaprenyltransferase